MPFVFNTPNSCSNDDDVDDAGGFGDTHSAHVPNGPCIKNYFYFGTFQKTVDWILDGESFLLIMIKLIIPFTNLVTFITDLPDTIRINPI